MTVSICIATHNKREHLRRVLESIFVQKSGAEVIVVDDGSDDGTCCLADDFPITYERIERECTYRNPSIARNVAMKKSTGDILILQSDDVIHGDGAIRELSQLDPGTFKIATVWNQFPDGSVGEMYTGSGNPRPFFFLGSVCREDIYAIGGNDEEFIEPGYDDNWLADCLYHGLGRIPIFCDVEGFHQDHPRADTSAWYAAMSAIYERKRRAAEAGESPWCASGGPWK